MGWTEVIASGVFDAKLETFRKTVEEQFAGMRKDIAALRGKPVPKTPAKTRGVEIAERMVTLDGTTIAIFDNASRATVAVATFDTSYPKEKTAALKIAIAAAIDSALAEQTDPNAKPFDMHQAAAEALGYRGEEAIPFGERCYRAGLARRPLKESP